MSAESTGARTRTRPGSPDVSPGADIAIPLYVYPTLDPRAWLRPVAFAERVRFVIVNVADGPGEHEDPAYREAIDRLHRAGVRTVGYVDTDYGRRPVADVAADAGTWVSRYGVRGVFLDQVAGDFAHLQHYAACSVAARAAGAQFVVVNPGTHCHPGLVDLANVVVTFEGSWQSYRDYRQAPWMHEYSPSRFCHLVFQVPQAELVNGPDLASRRHAATAFFTDGSGDNPWDRVPQAVLSAARPVRCEAGRRARTSPVTAWPARRYVPAEPDG